MKKLLIGLGILGIGSVAYADECDVNNYDNVSMEFVDDKIKINVGYVKNEAIILKEKEPLFSFNSYVGRMTLSNAINYNKLKYDFSSIIPGFKIPLTKLKQTFGYTKIEKDIGNDTFFGFEGIAGEKIETDQPTYTGSGLLSELNIKMDYQEETKFSMYGFSLGKKFMERNRTSMRFFIGTDHYSINNKTKINFNANWDVLAGIDLNDTITLLDRTVYANASVDKWDFNLGLEIDWRLNEQWSVGMMTKWSNFSHEGEATVNDNGNYYYEPFVFERDGPLLALDLKFRF
ncbi:hypothetical protein ACFL1H_06125 [Nanoarchaeota archaeon]